MSEKKSLFSGLFGRKKSGGCCNVESVEESKEENTPIIEGAMNIKILGSGCKNCVSLAENTKIALSQMGLEANIEKVTDLAAITGYGVMSTPALVVNEKVVSFGKVLKSNEIVKILEKVEK
ncbi:thioredoxin family protein [uncultured Clostridium sp.]|uniref:thioredoxin family protein n=1 Tax=uncultured Clostridium sp. TaxID=59620 RepID=UPI0028E7FB50|nr:thioredoxin family protein [uncultured Clostridium sp.]